MSFASDLMAGVAQLLAAAEVGTWQPTGVYPPSAVRPIYMRAVPAKPDRLITVSHYPVAGIAGAADTVEGIQVRNRGPATDDPRPADDDADEIRAALDGLEHVDVGGWHVSLIRWQSGGPLGQDANRRWEMTQNFYLHTVRLRATTTD
ncbi:minor capsid protein [Blastococcus sp. SYSU D00813]